MKLMMCFVLLGFCLSAVPKVYCIICAKCDPQAMDDCLDIGIDCSDDIELGHAFDSCFTYEMVAQRQDGTNFTHKIKNCSIRDGCEELRDLMCENANKTLNKLVKSCTINCCDKDSCNADESHFVLNIEPVPTAHERHSEPDVMGLIYDSSNISMPSFKVLHLLLLSLFLWSVIG